MSDEVSRRIETCHHNGDKYLDLSGFDLEEIPEELGWLVQLTELNLSNNRLVNLPGWLSNLSHLNKLHLQYNQLDDLPDYIGRFANLAWLNLSGNQLTRLPPTVGKLTGLIGLDLQGNRLISLPESIGNLTQLRQLDLQENRLTSLPESIGKLQLLSQLNLFENNLIDLPETIGHLTGLTALDLSNNQLTKLPESIGSLTRLNRLNLYQNRLNRIPDSIGNLIRLEEIDLRGSQMTALPEALGSLPQIRRLSLSQFDMLPPEVGAAAVQGQEPLLAFLRELASDAITIREAKLIIIGEGAVGKSSLLGAMRGEIFDANRTTTHGVEVKRLDLRASDVEIAFNVWDFGGQKTYRPTHQFFFTTPAVYIVAWNPRLGSTAGCVEEWINLVRRRVGDNVRIHIVATHSGPHDQLGDLEPDRLKHIHGDCIAGFHRIDSQTGLGITELKKSLAATAMSLPHLERRIPTRWYSLLNDLNESEASYLSYSKYLLSANHHGLSEVPADSLARVAAELGHWCYYPDTSGLEDLVVLQGDWLSKAISLVLNDPDTRRRNGLITHDHLSKLWNDPDRPEEDRYHPRIHKALRLLMREYQLAYQVYGSMSAPTSLISQLVPTVKPDLDEWERFGKALPRQTYIMEFVDGSHRTVIPEGLMYRLITWFHRFSLGSADYDRSIHWSGGMVLDDGYNGRALISVDGDQLSITVKAAYPTYLCKLISNDIRSLVRDWKGLTARILVPCADQCAQPGELWSGSTQFDVSRLQEMKSKRVIEDYCRACYKAVSIDSLIGEIGILTESDNRSESISLADIRKTLSRIEARVEAEGLQTRAHVTIATDAVVDSMRTEIDEQTQQYMRLLSDDAFEGPRLFTVEKDDAEDWMSGVLKRSIKVVLWCEHSRMPVHVLDQDPDKGVYKIAITPRWLLAARPWIGIAAQILRLGSDFVPAILKINLDEAQVKAMEGHLRLAELTAKELAASSTYLTDARSPQPTGLQGDQDTPQSHIRELHALLSQKDPSFGGLQRVRDRDRYLWVHSRFAQLYS
jgi:hypothetical protein